MLAIVESQASIFPPASFTLLRRWRGGGEERFCCTWWIILLLIYRFCSTLCSFYLILKALFVYYLNSLLTDTNSKLGNLIPEFLKVALSCPRYLLNLPLSLLVLIWKLRNEFRRENQRKNQRMNTLSFIPDHARLRSWKMLW